MGGSSVTLRKVCHTRQESHEEAESWRRVEPGRAEQSEQESSICLRRRHGMATARGPKRPEIVIGRL